MEAIEALALVSGRVDEELLKRNEYLAVENEILRSKIEGKIRLNDTERIRLAKLGHELGRKALEGVATIVKPETILGWFRELVAKKFDSSKSPRKPGRPRTPEEIEALIVKMAEENRPGGIQGSSAHCRTSASSAVKRPLPRSFAHMESHLLPKGSRAFPGPSSSERTRMCSPQQISSPPRC